MFGTEYQCKADRNNQGIAGEDEPARLPVSYRQDIAAHRQRMRKAVDDSLGSQCPDCSTDAVGHQHEEPLSRRPYLLIRTPVYKERTRDVEEVERYAVH